MELRGIENINNVINSFVEKFGLRADVGEDFAYYPELDMISYTFIMDERADRTFSAFVEEAFPEIHADLFLWSLFHEIGHHMTIDEWEEGEQDDFDFAKDCLARSLENEENDSLYYDYYRTADEYRATEWAAEYMENHEEEVEDFNEELKQALLDFFFLNRIES